MNYLENFKKFVKNRFCMDEIVKLCENKIGMCEIDLFILKEFFNYINAKNIVEFGCGTSTIFFNNIGMNVFNYALECVDVPDILKYKNVKHKTIEIEKSLDDIKKDLYNSDMLVIDCVHSKEQAEFYIHEILEKIKKPFFVHDFFGFKSTGYAWAEQLFLKKWIVDTKNYELFVYTDVEKEEIEEMNKLLNYDILIQKDYASYRPPPCGAIFIPKI